MWSDKQKEFYNAEFNTLASKKMEFKIRNKYVRQLVKMLKQQGIAEGKYEFLEVGCNEGIIMEMMKHEYPDSGFSGFDISDKHIAIAREKGLDVFVADAETFDTGKKYDVIYGTAVLHHLSDMQKFLSGLKMHLKEGGVIIFGPEPVHNNFLYIIWHSLRGFWEVEKGMLKMRKKEIRNLLKEHYSSSGIDIKGNAFVYAFKSTGYLWDVLRLSKLPFINDMYITARK